jgi:hypothetical protein
VISSIDGKLHQICKQFSGWRESTGHIARHEFAIWVSSCQTLSTGCAQSFFPLSERTRLSMTVTVAPHPTIATAKKSLTSSGVTVKARLPKRLIPS